MSDSKSPPASPPPPPTVNSRQLAKLNSPWFIWPATIALAVLLFFGLGYLIDVLTHESTDDAFIAAHVVSIAPRISGQIAAVHVLDNQMVRSNELLIEIDPANYAITVAQKQSAAASQDANVKTVFAVDELMRKKVATAEASARKAKADADAAAATAKWTKMDLDRAQELRKDNTVSQRELDAAQTTDTKTQADLKSAQENAGEENSKVDEAHAQLKAAETAVGLATSQWQEAQTNVASAQLDLSYTKIFAPCDGRVTRKAVETGNYVQVGQQLMSIVKIDALGKSLRAHVDSIQAGSGAAFSLLPPENATGNYVKVVQRVPVKIYFDEALPADHVIGPGLSVTPDVRVASFALPEWAIGLLALILTGVAVAVFRFVLNRKQI